MTMALMILFPEKVVPTDNESMTITLADEKTGLGFIMLLSGEPGVGKTLTAESGQLALPENLKIFLLNRYSGRKDETASIFYECRRTGRDSC